MSGKRQSDCFHTRWTIKPGGVIECSSCGEAIESEDLFTDREPVVIENIENTFTITPLTHRLEGLRLP